MTPTILVEILGVSGSIDIFRLKRADLIINMDQSLIKCTFTSSLLIELWLDCQIKIEDKHNPGLSFLYLFWIARWAF